MKSIFLIAVIFSISCRNHVNFVKTENQNYQVYKLDSINNYYLIYAKRNDSLFKIVTVKEKKMNCNLIKKGNFYKLKLVSMRDKAPTIGGVKIRPINYNDINCFQFDEETKICKENGINDLYFTEDIKGLCYILN